MPWRRRGAAGAVGAARPPPSRLAVLGFRLRQFIRPSIRSRTLLGPLGPRRDVAGASVDFADVHRGPTTPAEPWATPSSPRSASGLRHVLESAGEPVPTTLTVSEPVRLAGGAGSATRSASCSCDVPVATMTCGRRSRASRGRTRRRSRSPVRRDGHPIPAAAHAASTRSRAANGSSPPCASNVPGPRSRLVIAGATLVEVLPLAPLAGNVRVGVTVVSYDARLWLGVEADADHVAPAAGIAGAIAGALSGLAD
jgi:hypothetical protein